MARQSLRVSSGWMPAPGPGPRDRASSDQTTEVRLPLASTAYTMFANASNAGHGREDDAAVIKTFAGIELPGVEGKTR